MLKYTDLRIKNDYYQDTIFRSYAKQNKLTYLGCLALFGDNHVWAVFRETKEKKDNLYLLISVDNEKRMKLHQEAFKDIRYRDGVQCHYCKSIVYSSYKGHLQKCRCGNVAVDGGQDMLRISAADDTESGYTVVTIDLLTRRIV